MLNFNLSKTNIREIIIIFFGVIISVVVAQKVYKESPDIDIYLRAARGLSEKNNIYLRHMVLGGRSQYYYSPFFAWVLIPLAGHIAVTKFIWALLSILLLLRIRIIILDFFGKTGLSLSKQFIWLAMTLLFSVQFLTIDLINGQVTVFFLWAILESIFLIKNEKPVWAGVILAIGINVKIMPVMILAYLFYRGHFKAIGVCVVGFLVLLFLPALFIGWNYNQYLLTEWWRVINPENKEHVFEMRGDRLYSIPSLVPIFITHSIGKIPFLTFVSIIVNTIRLFLFSISLLFLNSVPFKKETNTVKFFWEAAYFILLIPLLLPHQRLYNFLFVLPMIIYLLYFFIKTREQEKIQYRPIVITGFALATIAFLPLLLPLIVVESWNRLAFQFTYEYKFISFSTLLIIPIALFCNPNKINSIGS